MSHIYGPGLFVENQGHRPKENGNWFVEPYIENTRFASFDIKFTRLGFENAC